MIDFSNITVIDTETTSNIPLKAEIAQLGVGVWSDRFEVVSKYYDTKEPMPYQAMAVNHITREKIAGLPLFMSDPEDLVVLRVLTTTYYVAHNSNYDSKILKAYMSASGVELTTPFICTMRLCERVYGDEIELKNLSYLRYRLALPVRENIGETHQADTDVEITGLLYERLVDDAIKRGLIDPMRDIHSQMFELCWSPKPITKFPMGKHKGKEFAEVPTDYYLWLLSNSDKLKEGSEFYDADFTNAVKAELETRVEPDPISATA